MNITAVINPVYSKSDNSQIDCTVICDLGTLNFTATNHDPMPYGRQLYADLIDEKYGTINPYVAPVT
jgi:hypothetical protein